MKTRFAIQYFTLFALVATISPYMQRFLRAKGCNDALVGSLQGIMYLGACGPMLLGPLAARFGRKRMMLACTLLTAGLLAGLSGAGTVPLAAAFIAGVGFFNAMLIPMTDTLATSELPDPAHTYGRVRIWGSVGFIVVLMFIGGAPTLCGLAGLSCPMLIDEHSTASMLRAMLIASGAFLVTTLGLPERHHSTLPPDPRDAQVHFDAPFYLFLAIGALHQFGMSGHYFFFSNYSVDQLHLPQGAWTWAIGSAAEMPFLFLGGRFLARLGTRTMLLISCLATACRVGAYAAFPIAAVALPAQGLHGLVFGFRHTASMEYLRRKVPVRRRALAMALYMSLAINLPMWAGGTLGGFVVQHSGYRMLYLLCALAPLVGAAAVLAAGKRFDVPNEPETNSRGA